MRAMSKIAIAAFNDGWADWEAGFVLSGLQEFFGFEVRIATPERQSVRSIGGVRAAADLSFAGIAAAPQDLLLVIGSDAWAARAFPEITKALQSAVRRGTPVGCICAATLAAAHAGLLDERRHTSNGPDWFGKNAPEAYRGRALYVDTPKAVADQGVVTAPGSAPVTFAAEVFKLVVPEREKDIAEFVAMSRAELI
jgi:putative intracellular protease/amidase